MGARHGAVAGLAAPLRAGEAARITAALRRRTELAGVFVNPPLDAVARAADELGLTLVQLHGDEGPGYCAEVARRTGCKVIKAARVAPGPTCAGSIASTPTSTCSTPLGRGPPAAPARRGTGR